MAATVVIEEANGAGPTWTPLTGITGRYCTEDSYNPGTNNPCKVPASNYYFSFWKSHHAKITGTFNSVRNIYWYCDGNVAADWGLGTNGRLQIGILDSPTTGNGCPTANYSIATGDIGTTGHDIGAAGSDGHQFYHDQVTPTANADNYTSATPLLIDTTQYTVSGSVTKMWVTQLKIAPNATQGDKTPKTFTIMYDEY